MIKSITGVDVVLSRFDDFTYINESTFLMIIVVISAVLFDCECGQICVPRAYPTEMFECMGNFICLIAWWEEVTHTFKWISSSLPSGTHATLLPLNTQHLIFQDSPSLLIVFLPLIDSRKLSHHSQISPVSRMKIKITRRRQKLSLRRGEMYEGWQDKISPFCCSVWWVVLTLLL